MSDIKVDDKEFCEVHGKDPNGIPRTYGYGPTWDLAETKCIEQTKEYLKFNKRPDVHPFEHWTFVAA